MGGRPCDVVDGGASISELASLPLSLYTGDGTVRVLSDLQLQDGNP